MIYSFFGGKDQAAITENLQVALADVITSHQDSMIPISDFWLADGGFISFTCFLEYVATPHVVNLLIQEDLQISESSANTHRIRSKKVGDAFQFADGNDQGSEELPVENNALTLPTVKIPPRPRPRLPKNARNGPQASTSKIRAPKQLKMNDFPPVCFIFGFLVSNSLLMKALLACG